MKLLSIVFLMQILLFSTAFACFGGSAQCYTEAALLGMPDPPPTPPDNPTPPPPPPPEVD